MNLVTVFKAFSPAEAELTRSRLEAAGTPVKEMWAELESLNLGRLRIASKGVSREGDRLVGAGVPPERALEAFYHPFAQLAVPFDELVPVADA